MPLKAFTESDFNVDPNSVKAGVELGKGNFSKVFKCEFEGRQVAMKQQELTDADLEKYLLNELAILREMKHEGCIKFYGAFKSHGNMVNILTEYLEGGDLRRLLKDKTAPLGWKYRSSVLMGCAQALAYMHSLEIIHRDIKTENVLMTADGKPKLCDFGFARIWDKSKTMTMCGTDEFMAPEVMFGMSYDEKVDVFSFGIVVAEVLTRKAPGRRDNFLDRVAGDGFNVNMEELEREVQPLNPPKSLVLFAKECVAPEAANRLSAQDMVAWLDECVRELPEDEEPKPVLSAEAIGPKLAQYLREEEEEEKEEDDERVGGGSSKPKTQEAKSRVEAALTERDEALHKKEAEGNGQGGVVKRSSRESNGGIFSKCFSSVSGGKQGGHANKSLEMAGWVTKRGGRIKTWKRRYMVITNLGIVYFKTPEEQHSGADAQGTIEYADMTAVAGVVANAVPTVMTGKANSFGVHTENRTYYISAANAEERGKWIRAISDGHRAFQDRKAKKPSMTSGKKA